MALHIAHGTAAQLVNGRADDGPIQCGGATSGTGIPGSDRSSAVGPRLDLAHEM